MPANILSDISESAKYFKLKRFDYAKNLPNGKVINVKEPAFVQYNHSTKTEEFVSSSFGGELYKVTLGENKKFTSSKTGQDFFSQDVFFEFHSYDQNQNLVREVVVVNRNSTLLEALVSRLYPITDFGNIAFQVGSFVPKGKVNYVDFCNVFLNGQKLPKMIGTKSEQYPLPDGALVLPDKVYDTVPGFDIDETTGKKVKVEKKELNKSWIIAKDEIFDTALEIVISAVEKYKNEHPKDYTPAVRTSQADVVTDELPEIDIDQFDDEVNKAGVAMPF